MKIRGLRVLRHALLFLLYGLLAVVLTVLVVAVVILDDRPDLHVWHTANLDEEFRVGHGVNTFEDYLALEDRLFKQLQEMVYDRVKPTERDVVNRYASGSLANPRMWKRNWNRTFELTVEGEPDAGVLLLHGLSDSPYSLRTLGDALHASGAWVVGLRIPGHGTAPSGLLDVEWEDMAAAVRIAAVHLKERIGDQPLYIVGYSNGGALAVEYALESLKDELLPRPDRLVLLSPEIGISKAAALASVQGGLGRVLGLQKLAWSSILPEYDPYKYNSFAVNAGDLAYRLTNHLRERILAMEVSGALREFPPVLAFQSAVDATVSMPALVKVLFDHLPENDHALVLFDLNRIAAVEELLTHDPKPEIEAMLGNRSLPFAFTAVTNRDDENEEVVARTIYPGREAWVETLLDTTWPREIYSLSHIALPFPRTDPLYGEGDAGKYKGIRLGNLALRGERGVLKVTPGDMLRQHWNPFYPYVEQRTFEFLQLAPPSTVEGRVPLEPRAY